MKILIIKLGAIGDVIRTTSILPGLKEKYKNCQIGWVTKKESYEILKNNKLVRKIFTGFSEVNEKYDLIISLDDDDEACKIATGLKPKKLIGAYMENGRKLYTKESSIWFDMGLISKYGRQEADRLKAINKDTYQHIMHKILGLKYRKQEPILILTKEEKNFGLDFAKKNKITKDDLVVGMNAGAGGRWQDKKLSVGQTAELIDQIKQALPKSKIILFGGPEERKRNREITKLAKSKIIDAGCDNSLIEFASLVDLCKILVTSDSLAMHVATALKKKIAVFFYPTSAAEIEVYGRGKKIIWEGKSYCSYQPKCEFPPKIEPGRIVEAVKGLAE